MILVKDTMCADVQFCSCATLKVIKKQLTVVLKKLLIQIYSILFQLFFAHRMLTVRSFDSKNLSILLRDKKYKKKTLRT